MLKSKNLVLRAVEPQDIDLLFEWENDETLWHLSNTIAPLSRFALEQYVLNAEQDIFSAKQLRLMIDKQSGEARATIGAIDLFDFDPLNKRAGVGILIASEERQKGYASEALDTLLGYCFGHLQLHQVYCNITAGNATSLQLFEHAGFEIVGIKKQWVLVDNSWVDEYLLQKINKHEAETHSSEQED